MLGQFKQLTMRLLPAGLAGRLRAWRVRRMIAAHSPRFVRHRYGSGPLEVYLADPLAEGWYDRDWPELQEIAWLRKSRLVGGARVFDLGAHQGVVAMMLAREVGDNGQVVAVEPHPHNVAAARRNHERNGFRNIVTVPAAVADRPGRLVFSERLNAQLDDGTGSEGRLTVEAVTIDDLAARFGPPDVVFLDVEGAECRALDGAAEVLRARPDVFVEVHVGYGLEKLGGSVERVFSFFPAGDYQLFGRAEADADFRPVTPADPLTRDRFFLLALAQRDQAAGATPPRD
jgi:FkbM family methyltransferase